MMDEAAMRRIAREVTDEVLGNGAYDHSNNTSRHSKTCKFCKEALELRKLAHPAGKKTRDK